MNLVEQLREDLKNQLVIQQKNRTNFDILALDQNLIQTFDLSIFLNKNFSIFKSQCIIPKTIFTDLFLNSNSENFLIVMSLIRDKVYQLYMEQIKPFEKNIQECSELVKNKTKVFKGQDATREQAWCAFMKQMIWRLKAYLPYAESLPGFDKTCTDDLITTLNDSLPVIFGLLVTKLFVDDECYLQQDEIQFTKRWMIEFVGADLAGCIFNFHNKINELCLTNQEVALLIPFVLTSPGRYFNLFK